MRVIGGTFRGRRLAAPSGLGVRPTPDRVREALFDILGDRAKGSAFLDLFAGSGAVGIEALSRGAGPVLLVENERAALLAIDRNLEALEVRDRVLVLREGWPGALVRGARSGPFSIVFADPPFARAPYAAILESLMAPGILGADARIILEHELRLGVPERVGELQRTRVARYGRVGLAIYTRDR